MSKLIKHKGIIKDIRNGIAKVEITQLSACSGCHARSYCSASDKKEKIIEVSCNGNSFKTGETVILISNSDIEREALLIAFVYPFFCLVAVLIIVYFLSRNETIAGITSLAILVPYYIIIGLYKKKLKKKFVFSLHKTD
ncbi:SoxR reducing system RseC family protein [Coprobacter tertius]|uniref:SoxR reducing system RseC family protein n=1 Tax=Coprobacter tertius TaxID=2944915 RepID=A0ABT1MH62_9BACT|nr:SoxR reducing system RseC family protein [Coprobacter tertius]MCP9611965.1 SoxR reducing system RseC family protein [Coprobacter tertius]